MRVSSGIVNRDYHDSYHDPDILSERREELSMAIESLLVKSNVHPHDAQIESINIEEAMPPKVESVQEAIVSWIRSRPRSLAALVLLTYIAVANMGGTGSVGLWTLAVFAIAVCGWFSYDRYAIRVARRRMAKRACIEVYFTAVSQLFNKRQLLDDLIEFLGGDRASSSSSFQYGFNADEGKCFLRWEPASTDAQWLTFLSDNRDRTRSADADARGRDWVSSVWATVSRAKAVGWDLLAPTSMVSVGCLLTMVWAAMFLWRHWYGYSRPIEGVWRVSRHYFAGTPLAFLLAFV